jgi:alkylhydroperoxidase family enzyme
MRSFCSQLRQPELVDAWLDRMISGSGSLDPTLRRSIVVGKPDERAGRFVDKVAHSPRDITNGDFDALRDLGYNEDQMFELTVLAAVTAGLEHLRRGLAIGGL